MKRFFLMVVVAGLLALAASAAYADSFLGKVAGWLSGEVVSLIVSAVVAILAGAVGFLFIKVQKTFVEGGEFLMVLGLALDDRRVSREELAAILKEGKDVFSLWKKTPEKYKVE